MPSDSKTEKTLQQLRLLVQLGLDTPIAIELIEDIYEIPATVQRDWRRGRHCRKDLARALRTTKLGDTVLVTLRDWRRFVDCNAEDTEQGESDEGPGLSGPQVD